MTSRGVERTWICTGGSEANGLKARQECKAFNSSYIGQWSDKKGNSSDNTCLTTNLHKITGLIATCKYKCKRAIQLIWDINNETGKMGSVKHAVIYYRLN